VTLTCATARHARLTYFSLCACLSRHTIKLRAHLFPLPIPKLTPDTPGGDLHYMSLTESMLLPFTDAHQPSKMTRAATTAAKDSVSSSALGPIKGRGNPQGRRGRGRSNRVASDDVYVVRVQHDATTTQKIIQ
jgi:hypothetical protein